MHRKAQESGAPPDLPIRKNPPACWTYFFEAVSPTKACRDSKSPANLPGTTIQTPYSLDSRRNCPLRFQLSKANKKMTAQRLVPLRRPKAHAARYAPCEPSADYFLLPHFLQAFFAGAFFAATFLAGAFFAGAFLAGAFFAGAFFAATFLAGAFFAGAFFAGAFLAGAFLATAFLAGAFFAAVFLGAAFFTAMVFMYFGLFFC